MCFSASRSRRATPASLHSAFSVLLAPPDSFDVVAFRVEYERLVGVWTSEPWSAIVSAPVRHSRLVKLIDQLARSRTKCKVHPALTRPYLPVGTAYTYTHPNC